MIMVAGKELILGLFAQTATKNAKSRSSPAETVRYIVRNAFQSAKKATCLTQTGITGPKKEIFPGNAVPINGRLKKGKSPLKRRSPFLHVQKNVLKYLDEIKKVLNIRQTAVNLRIPETFTTNSVLLLPVIPANFYHLPPERSDDNLFLSQNLI